MSRGFITLLLITTSPVLGLKLERANAVNNLVGADTVCAASCKAQKACCGSLEANFDGLTTRRSSAGDPTDVTQDWEWSEASSTCLLDGAEIPNNAFGIKPTACQALKEECEGFHGFSGGANGCSLNYDGAPTNNIPAESFVDHFGKNDCTCGCSPVVCSGDKAKQPDIMTQSGNAVPYSCTAKDCETDCCETKCKDQSVTCPAGTELDTGKEDLGCANEADCKATCCSRTDKTCCEEHQAENLMYRWDETDTKCYKATDTSYTAQEEVADPCSENPAHQCWTVGKDFDHTWSLTVGGDKTVTRRGKDRCKSSEVLTDATKHDDCTEKGCCNYAATQSHEACCKKLIYNGKPFVWEDDGSGVMKCYENAGTKIERGMSVVCKAVGDYWKNSLDHTTDCAAMASASDKFERTTECCEQKTCATSAAADVTAGCTANDAKTVFDPAQAAVECDDDTTGGDCWTKCCKPTEQSCCDTATAKNSDYRFGGGLGSSTCWSGEYDKVFADASGVNNQCGTPTKSQSCANEAECTDASWTINSADACKTYCATGGESNAMEWYSVPSNKECRCLNCNWSNREPAYARENWVGFTYDKVCDDAQCDDKFEDAIACDSANRCWKKNENGLEVGLADACATTGEDAVNVPEMCFTVKDKCTAETHKYAGPDDKVCSNTVSCVSECCTEKTCADKAASAEGLTCPAGKYKELNPSFKTACSTDKDCKEKCCHTCSKDAPEDFCHPSQCPGFYFSRYKCRACTEIESEKDCAKPWCPGFIFWEKKCQVTTATLRCTKYGHLPDVFRGACGDIVKVLKGISNMPSPVDKVFVLAKVLLEFMANTE